MTSDDLLLGFCLLMLPIWVFTIVDSLTKLFQ
jgi:hypothetical protein